MNLTDMVGQSQENPTNSELKMVCTINSKGRIIESLQNHFQIKKSIEEMLLMEIALIQRMLSDFDNEYGSVCYNITCRKNLKFVSVPVNAKNSMLLVVDRDMAEHKIGQYIESCLFWYNKNKTMQG